MFDFLKRRRKSSGLSYKGRAAGSSQRQLDTFPRPVQERQTIPNWESSIKQMESEVSEGIKSFNSRVKEMKETSMRLEELLKMLKAGDISENVHNLIMSELGDQLSMAVEEIFRLREMLEIAKARAKLEWAKEKIGLKEVAAPPVQSTSRSSVYTGREPYTPVSRWQEIASRIDTVLSSLTVDEEASIIEQYLSLIKERLAIKGGSEGVERGLALCQRRIIPLSDKWSALRRSQIEKIMNLELEASRLREELKEFDIRYAVGELDQIAYENNTSASQVGLKNLEKEISDTRKHVDDMDMKVFRCSELLRENA